MFMHGEMRKMVARQARRRDLRIDRQHFCTLQLPLFLRFSLVRQPMRQPGTLCGNGGDDG